MSSRRTPGLTKKKLRDGRFEWYIDKRIKGYGRLCESTGTGEVAEAEDILAKRVAEIRKAVIFGERPKRVFRDAATRFLTENAHKRGIARDAEALADMDEFIGDLSIADIHDGSFDAYRETRRNPTELRAGRRTLKSVSNSTLNRNIGVAARVLQDAARKWRDDYSKLTWLAEAPFINANMPHKKRQPYPLSWDEQRLFFSELVPHLETMAMFMVEAGPRDEELCALEWAWEVRVPELDTDDIKRSVFIIPPEATKTRTEDPRPRLLVLNDAAQSIVESVRGQHNRFVFTREDWHGRRDRMSTMLSSGWRRARVRAARKYRTAFGVDAPAGFRRLRVHDLRHTFGRRLRAANVSREDRRDLFGHSSESVTTDYSAAEIGNLVTAANQVTKSRKSPALTMLRVIGETRN
jgi:integrase